MIFTLGDSQISAARRCALREIFAKCSTLHAGCCTWRRFSHGAAPCYSHGAAKCQNFFARRCTVRKMLLDAAPCENFFARCGTVQNFSHGAAPCEKIMLDSSKISSHGAAPCENFCTVPHRAKKICTVLHRAKIFARCGGVRAPHRTVRKFVAPCGYERPKSCC